MNNEELIDVKTLRPFRRFIYTIGELPSSYLMSMTYEEQLIWLCNYLKETVIPALNNNGLAVEELQAKYIELKSYVDNYFEDLDVQDEINNKLDEMALDGTLENLIGQYIQLTTTYVYNNVAEMKTATNLVNGSYARTSGFYTYNDGGGSYYKVRTVTNEDVIDEMTIIALNNPLLVAVLIYNSEINIMQLGAKRWDGEHEFDNKLVIDKAISLFPFGGKIVIPVGKFFTSGNHIIDRIGKLTITGYGSAGFNDGSCIEILDGADYGFWIQNANFDTNIMVGHEISNLHLIGNSTLENCIIISDHFGSILKDLYITGIPTGNAIMLYNYEHFTEGTIIENCHIRTSLNGIKVKRNISSLTATESFFNTKIINCIMSLDYDNAMFINLNEYNADTDKTLMAYSWNISATIWYQNEASNNFVIKVGFSSMLTGNAIINVDGLHANQYVIENVGSGTIQLKGSVNYNNGYGLTSIDDAHLSDLLYDSGGDSDGYNRGKAQFEGLKICNGERIGVEKANTVIYTSNRLPCSSAYRLTICEDTAGIKKTNVYLITTSNISLTPCITKLTTLDSYFTPRPIGNREQGVVAQEGGVWLGGQFEIYCGAINGTAPTYFILEML